ncbi:hypothetical protein SLE2022_271200 [Rubroshorea leprosula]
MSLKLDDEDLEFTFDNIKAILVDIFVAGMDTSSATVIWVITFPLKHPTAMKKVQDETTKYSSITYIPLKTIRDCNIGGYKILAKTLVYVNAWAIGRDTEACGQNVEEFYPERFIGSSIDYKGQDFGLTYTIWLWSENSPWEEYIGAIMVELVLANLLYRFDWEIPFRMKKEDIDFDTAPGITMHKRNALYLMAKECKY